MMNYKKIALVVGVMSLMIIVASCTSKTAGTSSSNTAAATAYQNPTVNCQVNSGSTTLLTVSNITQSAPGLFNPPPAPAAISLNCVGSQAHSPNSTLSFAYSVNNGPLTVFNGMSASGGNLNFNSHGANTITLVATDSAGLSTSVTFAMPVTCTVGQNGVTALKGVSGLSVTQGSDGPGYANVSFSGGGSGGGGGPYQYAIDVNGDGNGVGRFDYYSPTPNSSTPPPVYSVDSPNWQNLYNFYSGSRTIYVQTYDTACQFMTTTAVPYNWSTGVLSGAQTGAMTAIPPAESYYYLQANVSGSSSDPAENVSPFDARDQGTAGGDHLHVICNWADQGGASAPTQGAFSIQAVNTYNDGVSSDQGPLTESMTMSWNIPENGSMNIGPQTVPLQTMTYQTSASPNGAFQQYQYNMNSGCSAYVQVTRITAPTTCAGQSNNGYTWGNATIQGTFSCPGMSSTPSGRTLNLNNGYFYCQTGPGDNCIGSGQEGGTPPPTF